MLEEYLLKMIILIWLRIIQIVSTFRSYVTVISLCISLMILKGQGLRKMPAELKDGLNQERVSMNVE